MEHQQVHFDCTTMTPEKMTTSTNIDYYKRECVSSSPISGTVESIHKDKILDNFEFGVYTYTELWLIKFVNGSFCKINVKISSDFLLCEPIYDDFIGKNIIITLMEININDSISYDLQIIHKDVLIGHIGDAIDNINDIDILLSLGG
jgi:hypothetical protein